MAEDYLELPDIYHSTPLRALRMTARKKLSGFLDIEGSLVVCGQVDVVNDYSGLAELAGFKYLNISNMKRQKSPTEELLEKWTGRLSATIGILWQFLAFMERFDVLSDCRACIIRDCAEYAAQQTSERDLTGQDPTVSTTKIIVDEPVSDMEQEVSTTVPMIVDKNESDTDEDDIMAAEDETEFVTVQDVRTGRRTYYDAFIGYHQYDDNDRKFLLELIDELEQKRKLKLFIPGRDDLPGGAEHTITAYVIEKRCRRIVILISRKFLKSAVCDFQLKFAHALSPGARSRKLIPVIRERGTPVPRILLGHVVVDFSKSDMIEWAWGRIHSAIIAPIDRKTYLEADMISNRSELDESLKLIAYPTNRRMDENEDRSEYNELISEAGSVSLYMRTPSGPMEHEMYFSQPSTNVQSDSQGAIAEVSMSAENGKRNPTTCSNTSQSQTSTRGNLTSKRAITRPKQQKPIPPKKPKSINALI